MNGFTETIFSFLLGWVKSFFENLWNFFSKAETSTWFNWVLENWVALVIILCVAGFVVDLIVWFFRWRPYYVWGSVWRKFKGLFSSSEKTAEESKKNQNTSYRQNFPRALNNQQPRQIDETRVMAQWPNQRIEDPGVNLPFYANNGNEMDEMEETRQVFLNNSVPPYTKRPDQMQYSPDYIQQYAKPQDFYENSEEAQMTPSSAKPQKIGEQVEETGDWNETVAVASYLEVERHRTQEIPFQVEPLKQQEEATNPFKVQQAQETIDFISEQVLEDMDDINKQPTQPVPVPSRRRRRHQQHFPFSQWEKSLTSIARRAGHALNKDDVNQQLLDGLPPPVDKERAFHQPVYPQRRKAPPSPDEQQ